MPVARRSKCFSRHGGSERHVVRPFSNNFTPLESRVGGPYPEGGGRYKTQFDYLIGTVRRESLAKPIPPSRATSSEGDLSRRPPWRIPPLSSRHSTTGRVGSGASSTPRQETITFDDEETLKKKRRSRKAAHLPTHSSPSRTTRPPEDESDGLRSFPPSSVWAPGGGGARHPESEGRRSHKTSDGCPDRRARGERNGDVGNSSPSREGWRSPPPPPYSSAVCPA